MLSSGKLAPRSDSSRGVWNVARMMTLDNHLTKAFAPWHRLAQFFVLTYLVTLINTFGFLRHASFAGVTAVAYTLAVYISYSALYLLPSILLVALAGLVLRPSSSRSILPGSAVFRGRAIWLIAIALTTLTQVLIYADRQTFTIFGMHINGFIWNTVFTSGGLESMGESRSATIVYATIMAGYLVVQVALAAVSIKSQWIGRWWAMVLPKRRALSAAAFFLVCVLGQTITYGLSDIWSYSPVLISASAFPLYQPVTFRHLARDFGMEVDGRNGFHMSVKTGRIRYPLQPLEIDPPAHPFNIVWLVSESLRADMLDPEIMPRTWDFAQQAHRFTNHYSGGNGTRMGMFSMFYGLYGNLWFTFLDEHRGPVLIDVVKDQNYQMKMFTSARFTYPEFDRTVFAAVPSELLHEEWGGAGWERDRRNVEEIEKFLDGRDPQRPFMTFLFYESPHARYYFPDESIIRRPFLDDFNYATMNLERDMPLIKNRYINACHHLDSQIDRLLEYLRRNNLLDSTIVVITGDHGEEFMEKGRWGHNSEFTEEQVRTPMVLWIPGTGASVSDAITSHLDLPATILPVLGVRNDPRDYSLGASLLTGPPREYTVIADWSRVAYLDDQYKASFPMKVGGLLRNSVTTRDDAPVPDTDDFYKTRQPRLMEVMKDMNRFGR